MRAAAGRRFKLTHRVNNHYGSTSGAMSRELCGKWGAFNLDGRVRYCGVNRR